VDVKVTLERNRVYCLDCLDGLPLIESGSVDLVVTSPPYNCRKDYGVVGDELPWPEYYSFLKRVLGECYRVLVPGGVIAVNVPNVVRWQFDHKFRDTWSDYDAEYKGRREGVVFQGKGRIEPLGLNVFFMMRELDKHMREPITWVKGGEDNAICSSYQMGCDSDPYMRPAQEMILLGSKGRWFHDGGTGRRGKDAVPFLDYTKDVWHITPRREVEHPAVFPLEIPLRLIRLFVHRGGACVLDPFMGLGTTAVAAKREDVDFIGFEKNPVSARLAAKNVEQSFMSDYLENEA
jgi:DNA modification methylase